MRFVIAETDYTNVASGRVLQKAGFWLYASKNHFLYWRKEKHAKRVLSTDKGMADGHFALYDLAVVVESIDGNCTCNMQVGDCFFLRNSSNLSLPDGKHFCVYALQATLPLLPATKAPATPSALPSVAM